ncbi:MAG TPA: tetratricopeptide repeat protein [bacterium]|nr:tetratricopeptide repeat protein [bacterium]
MRTGDRLDALLSGAAFLAAAARTWPLLAPSDAGFHLVRIGNGLAQAGIAAYGQPPGGEGAPLLGAVVGGIGALFATGLEDLGRAPGAMLAGAAAALLTWTLAVRVDRLTAVLGAALLIAPPAFASSFVARPDAAAGGLLLLASFVLRWRDETPTRALVLAWTAALATPAAAAAAVAMQAAEARRSRARDWLPAGVVIALVAVLSLSLPGGHRAEILRGLVSDWTLPPAGWESTGAALARVWGFGALLALPLLLLKFGDRPERRLVAPWAAAVGASALLSDAGMFREALAGWTPATCLLLALLARRGPEPAGTGGPPRLILAGLAVPLGFLLLGRGEAAGWRTGLHEAAARDAQIAAFLRDQSTDSGAVVAERTGVLAVTSTRVTRPLRGAESVAGAAPAVVVFGKAVRPSSPEERDLFSTPEFLGRYAPYLFRRGPTQGIQDAVWVRRRDPVPIRSLDPEYPKLLIAGWGRQAAGDPSGARRSFQAAAALEPNGLGLAREWAGLMFEREMDSRTAETFFVQALPDPTTVLARGHLADRALSGGRIARADSLLAQAFEFSDREASLWGVRARLQALAGDPAAALEDSERAVRLHPREARLLANHGILLWMTGQPLKAREFWRLAVRNDPRVLQYLGDFEKAPDDARAPPLLPLFSLEGFHPDVSKRPGGPPPGDG